MATAVQHFTKQLIDYAGLFPPAGLPMQTVVRQYASYVTGERANMLGRLIIPTSRLEEFESLSAHLLPDTSKSDPWRISALVPPVDAENAAYDAALLAIESFNERHQKPQQGKALIDAIEIRSPTISNIQEVAASLPPNLSAFLEVPYHDDPDELVASIAACQTHETSHLYAKIRTGGVTEDLIPTPAQVASFIHRCVQHDVGFKATAGLHHPLRCLANLTYEPDSDSATMHGFVNVFVASILAFAKVIEHESEIAEVLTADQSSAFEFGDQQIVWKDKSITKKDVKLIRRSKVISFGSCSFDEPTEELELIAPTSSS